METKQLLQAIRTLIQEEIAPINHRLDRVDSRLDQIDSRLTNIETDVAGVKTQLHETNQIARNIEHAAAELTAQVDNIAITTAKIEGSAASKEHVADLSAQFRVMNDRLFRQEVETEKLKAVK